AVVRRVDDPAGADRGLGDLHVLADALDLAEDGVERMLERAVDRVPLRGAKLVEIAFDPLTRDAAALTMAAPEIPGNLIPGEHGAGNLVEHCGSEALTDGVCVLDRRRRPAK